MSDRPIVLEHHDDVDRARASFELAAQGDQQ